MKKFALTAFASAAALSLTACGSSDDASEDAIADNVEIPADEAMAGLPDPVADTTDDAQTAEETRQSAEQAADNAVATVDDVEAAIRDAEAATD